HRGSLPPPRRRAPRHRRVGEPQPLAAEQLAGWVRGAVLMTSTHQRRRSATSGPTLDARGWLRFLWRQLTSMRTALFLLLLLAVAAVPGSVFPQRSIDATRTTDWIADRPTLGPILDRLGFFEVYSTPWFASIYLLLFVSLFGCVLPRARVHWKAMREHPPRTPARLERLAAHQRIEVAKEDAEPTLAALEKTLRQRRYRVHRHAPGTL